MQKIEKYFKKYIENQPKPIKNGKYFIYQEIHSKQNIHPSLTPRPSKNIEENRYEVSWHKTRH